MTPTSQKSRVDGKQTFWNLCDHFDREVLYEGLKELKWRQHCPLKRSNSSALKEALQELVRQWKLKDVMVRPLDNVDEDGYAVVLEETGSTHNDYETLFTVKWERPSDNVEPYTVLTEYSHKADNIAINKWFQHYRKRITSHAVAKMMKVIIVERLAGISLRPSGGFYWIPAQSLDLYADLIKLIEKAADGKCKIYLPEFNLSDPGAVEAVRDAIIDDITRRKEIIEEQAKREGVRQKALENRKQDAKSLHDRVREYEGFLGEALGELHKVADECESHVVSAAVEQFPDFFGIGDQVKKQSQAQAPLVTPAEVSDEPVEITAADVNPFAVVPA